MKEFYISKIKIMTFLVATLIFVFGSLFLLKTVMQTAPISWAYVVICSLLLTVSMFELFHGMVRGWQGVKEMPILVIEEEGFYFRGWFSQEFIPWSNVLRMVVLRRWSASFRLAIPFEGRRDVVIITLKNKSDMNLLQGINMRKVNRSYVLEIHDTFTVKDTDYIFNTLKKFNKED